MLKKMQRLIIVLCLCEAMTMFRFLYNERKPLCTRGFLTVNHIIYQEPRYSRCALISGGISAPIFLIFWNRLL